MMKKIIITVMITSSIISLCGCSNSNVINPDDVFESPDKRIIDLEVVDHNFYGYIFVDKNTNVLYYYNVSSTGGITPIYNSDGTLKLYK